MDEKLSQFVEHARQKGLDYSTISLVLTSAGWKEKEIAEAFCARELEMPVPERAGLGSARDAFFHLTVFAALYACAGSLILLFFTYINFLFPDPAWRQSYYYREYALSNVRGALAALIVAYPIFAFTWRFLLRDVRRHPEKAKVAIRRWLCYLSLFAGGVIVSGDVITLIYFLLEGQLTVRFLLKVLVLLVIAGGLFLYLLLTLRAETEVTT